MTPRAPPPPDRGDMNIVILTWSVLYFALRLWWTVGGSPVGDDLGVLSGWPSLLLCAAAAAAALWRRWWASVAVAGILATAAYRFVLDLFGLAMPGSGIGFDLGPFLSRAACLTGAALLLVSGLLGRPQRTGRWARTGACTVLAAFAVRVVWQIGFEPTTPDSVTFADDPLMGSLTMIPFVIAGVVLPLALVHAPLTRRLPRWTLVVPAITASVLILAYFASGTITLAARALTDDAEAARILRGTWLADLAYVAWGVGLALAATRAPQPQSVPLVEHEG